MDKETLGWGGIGFLALFILIIIGFCGRNWNGNHNCPGYDFQNFKATCDAEKAEIINSATTQYKVEQQAAATRELVNATAQTTQAKIDFYSYQDLRDKLSEAQRMNMLLQNQLFMKDQLAPITASIADIRCNMLVRPSVTGIGAVCPNSGIINGLGINSLNNCYGNL